MAKAYPADELARRTFYIGMAVVIGFIACVFLFVF